MTRRILLTLALAFVSACKPAESGPPLPVSVGAWRLASTSAIDPMPRSDHGFLAHYNGEPEVALRLYQMPSQTVAFDTLQSWRGETGKLAFYKGKYFGIAESPGAGQRVLNGFVSAVQKQMPD